MAQLLAPSFGSGQDGELTISSNTTDSPVDSACTGTSGTTSLSATNASFSAGDRILIHQSQGTGAGNWEVNTISSYTAGTITTSNPLANSYVSGAQVLVMKEYSGATISSTLTAKAWNGTVGGVLAYCVSGKLDVSGTITAVGKGYRNNDDTTAANTTNGDAYQGEGSTGTGSRGHSANNTGGGGGQAESASTAKNATGGGGGSHATSGTNGSKGTSGTGSQSVGIGATTTTGSTNLSTMTFGGSGGNGGSSNDDVASTNWGWGGHGGGIIVIFAKEAEVSGSVTAAGQTATASNGKGGGGGAGGSVLIKTAKATLGSSKVKADGGNGQDSQDANPAGGDGGDGRIRIEACSLTGSTTPSASTSTGGHSYCGGTAIIY